MSSTSNGDDDDDDESEVVDRPLAATTGRERKWFRQPNHGVGEKPQPPQPLQPSTHPTGARPPDPTQLWQSAPNQRRIHKVPWYLDGQESQHGRVYEPAFLSVGPYHATKPECFPMNMFKNEMLYKFIGKSIDEGAAADWNHWFERFYGDIRERIDEINEYYDNIEEMNYEAGLNLMNQIEMMTSQKVYDPLAVAILRDACYIASYIKEVFEDLGFIIDHLGPGAGFIIFQDLYKVENQIPFDIVKRILDTRFGQTEGDEIVCKYLSACFLDHYQLDALPWKDNSKHQPLHLLEARRITLLKSQLTSRTESDFLRKLFKWGKIWQPRNIWDTRATDLVDLFDSPFRSVTYLQTKGIYVRSNSSYSLTDITFTSNPCYGILHLPTLIVSNITKVLFSNLIAFEILEGIQTSYTVTCYINFMKSLIESPEDVKKLQEKHILRSQLGSDEEIVKTFKEISTHGINGFGIFTEVKRGIDKHCDSKAKTWMSEIGHKYFHSTWSIIAFGGAFLTLILTFLQVYLTLYPPKSDKSSPPFL